MNKCNLVIPIISVELWLRHYATDFLIIKTELPDTISKGKGLILNADLRHGTSPQWVYDTLRTQAHGPLDVIVRYFQRVRHKKV